MAVKKHHSVYFNLWKQVKSDLEFIAQERQGGRFGIMSSGDYYAKLYQDSVMRFEILTAYLEGRTPNWYKAPYLTRDEKDKRNSLYI